MTGPGRSRRLSAALAVMLPLLGLPLLSGCGVPSPGPGPSAGVAERGQTVLRVGAIPDQDPEQLNRLYDLVSGDLADQLGRTVVYVPVVDYTAAVSSFRNGDLDLVWFGGLTGVQARLQTPGARVIAQRGIDAEFRSVFIANRSSGLQPFKSAEGLQTLAGRRFTFGSESSTSGRLMPQYFLDQAGIETSDFQGGTPGFSGSHDATIALVQSGAYEAGAVNGQVWRTRLEEGKVDPERVIALWWTPPYPDYHWIARPDLDDRFGAGFTDKVQQAILAWSPQDDRQQQILELFGAERFIEAEAGAYASIETVGRRIGKIN